MVRRTGNDYAEVDYDEHPDLSRASAPRTISMLSYTHLPVKHSSFNMFHREVLVLSDGRVVVFYEYTLELGQREAW